MRDAVAAMNDGPDQLAVTLHSSRGAMVFTGVGMAGFVALAAVVVLLNGLNIVTVVISVLAMASTIVMLLDLPVSASFDESGIHRTTPLRRHQIAWTEVDRLTRMRRGGIRRPGSAKRRGIVALRGRKRTVLVDRTEDAQEHARLRAVLTASLAVERFAALLMATTDHEPEPGTDNKPEIGNEPESGSRMV